MSFLAHLLAIVVSPIIAVSGFFFVHHAPQPVPQSASSTPTVTDVSASTSANTEASVPLPVPKNTPTTKTVIVPTTHANPAPVSTLPSQTTNSSLDTTAADVSDLSNTLSAAIGQFQTLEANTQKFSTTVNSDAAQYAYSIPSYVSFASQTLSTISSFSVEVQSYITLLQTAKNQVVSSGAIDKGYWTTTGIPNIVATQSNYSQQLLNLEQLYVSGRAVEQTQVYQPSYQQPAQNSALQQQTQQVLQTQNCINQKAQYLETTYGYDKSQAMVAAIGQCPSN